LISVGGTSTGIVFLSGEAPEGEGITLGVSSSNPTVFVPAEGAPVDPGANVATFDIQDEGGFIFKPKFADIRVTYEGVTPPPARLTVSPSDDKVFDKIIKERGEDFPIEFRSAGGDPASAAQPADEPDQTSGEGEAFIRPEERPEVEPPDETDNE